MQPYHIKTAMFVRGQGNILVAYKDKIWLLNSDNDPQTTKYLDEISEILELDEQIDDAYTLLSEIKYLRPDVLIGFIDEDNRSLEINSDEFVFGSGSHLLQKVMNTLGLYKVEYLDDGNTYRILYRPDITGDIPTSLFHGTNSINAEGILKFGLMPDKAYTNFPDSGPNNTPIYHPDTVFLAEDMRKAAFHALHSARQQSYSFPVIFKFRIPDISKLVPDYDAERISDSYDTYKNLWNAMGDKPKEYQQIKETPFQLSKQSGVFGYRGRIPASFIEDIYIPQNSIEEYNSLDLDVPIDEWVSVTPSQLRKAIDVGDIYGAWYEDEPDDYSEDYEDSYDYQYQTNINASSNMLKTIKKANSNRLHKHVTYNVRDVDRYLTDDYVINLSLVESKSRYSIGIYLTNQKVGLGGYQEYWHYPLDQQDRAIQTYNQISRIVKEVTNDISYNNITCASIKPRLQYALNKVDPEHKERSGVFSYNVYATEVEKESDWRQSLYGKRYPQQQITTMFYHQPKINKQIIEQSGQGRNTIMNTKYASIFTPIKWTHKDGSQQEELIKIPMPYPQIIMRNAGWREWLGEENTRKVETFIDRTLWATLGAMAGAFITWYAISHNLPIPNNQYSQQQLVQTIEQDPNIEQQVKRFMEHAEIPAYEQGLSQAPSANLQHEEQDASKSPVNIEYWVEGIIHQESKGDPQAVSNKGARGIMQIMEPTWKEMTKQIYGKELPFEKAFDPDINREVAIEYLKWIQRTLRKWMGKEPTIEDILAAYNGGIGRYRKTGYDLSKMPKETRDYVSKITSRVRNNKGLKMRPSSPPPRYIEPFVSPQSRYISQIFPETNEKD